MEHVVFYPGADGAEAFSRAADLEEAVRVVERLRNDNGIGNVTVYALQAVPLAYRTYVHVELPVAEPAFDEPVAEATAEQTVALAEPTVEDTAVEDTIVEEPVVEEAVALEEHVLDPAVDEESFGQEFRAEEPVAEEPVSDLPVAEEPVSELPAAEEPVAGLPLVEELPRDQVEPAEDTFLPPPPPLPPTEEAGFTEPQDVADNSAETTVAVDQTDSDVEVEVSEELTAEAAAEPTMPPPPPPSDFFEPLEDYQAPELTAEDDQGEPLPYEIEVAEATAENATDDSDFSASEPTEVESFDAEPAETAGLFEDALAAVEAEVAEVETAEVEQVEPEPFVYEIELAHSADDESAHNDAAPEEAAHDDVAHDEAAQEETGDEDAGIPIPSFESSPSELPPLTLAPGPLLFDGEDAPIVSGGHYDAVEESPAELTALIPADFTDLIPKDIVLGELARHGDVVPEAPADLVPDAPVTLVPEAALTPEAAFAPEAALVPEAPQVAEAPHEVPPTAEYVEESAAPVFEGEQAPSTDELPPSDVEIPSDVSSIELIEASPIPAARETADEPVASNAASNGHREGPRGLGYFGG